jgi:hypothetical protein
MHLRYRRHDGQFSTLGISPTLGSARVRSRQPNDEASARESLHEFFAPDFLMARMETPFSDMLFYSAE